MVDTATLDEGYTNRMLCTRSLGALPLVMNCMTSIAYSPLPKLHYVV